MSLRFHLAFPVRDLDEARAFYEGTLGCEIGRQGSKSLILKLGSAQIVAHLTEDLAVQDGIYPRHFGLVFDVKAQWESQLEQIQAAGAEPFDGPRVRYQDGPLEQHTFFIRDPSGNVLEFKHYTHEAAVFGRSDEAAAGDADDSR